MNRVNRENHPISLVLRGHRLINRVINQTIGRWFRRFTKINDIEIINNYFKLSFDIIHIDERIQERLSKESIPISSPISKNYSLFLHPSRRKSHRYKPPRSICHNTPGTYLEGWFFSFCERTLDLEGVFSGLNSVKREATMASACHFRATT